MIVLDSQSISVSIASHGKVEALFQPSNHCSKPVWQSTILIGSWIKISIYHWLGSRISYAQELHPPRLAWPWKIPMFNRKYIFEMMDFPLSFGEVSKVLVNSHLSHPSCYLLAPRRHWTPSDGMAHVAEPWWNGILDLWKRWLFDSASGRPCVESGLDLFEERKCIPGEIQAVTFLIPARLRSLNLSISGLQNSTRLVPLTQKISRSSSQQWGWTR